MSLGGMFVIRCKYVEPKSVTCQIQTQLQAFSSLGLPPTSQVLLNTDTHHLTRHCSQTFTLQNLKSFDGNHKSLCQIVNIDTHHQPSVKQLILIPTTIHVIAVKLSHCTSLSNFSLEPLQLQYHPPLQHLQWCKIISIIESQNKKKSSNRLSIYYFYFSN